MTKKILFAFLLLFSFQNIFAEDDDDVFVYLLKYHRAPGESVVVYCGITNDPERRAFQHATGGTMGYNTFDTMHVIDGPMSRREAFALETRCIEHHEIPRMYQPRSRILDDKKIAEYESRYDPSRLTQTPDPEIVFAENVINKLFNIQNNGDTPSQISSQENLDGTDLPEYETDFSDPELYQYPDQDNAPVSQDENHHAPAEADATISSLYTGSSNNSTMYDSENSFQLTQHEYNDSYPCAEGEYSDAELSAASPPNSTAYQETTYSQPEESYYEDPDPGPGYGSPGGYCAQESYDYDDGGFFE